jgi:hypothetical protein
MYTRLVGMALFLIGVFLLLVHTTLPLLWSLAGIPEAYPLISSNGIEAFLPGFTPPIGALIMLLGGIVYGRRKDTE